MSDIVIYFIGVLGFISLILLVKAFKADGGFRNLTPLALLLFAAVILPSMTTIVGVFFREKMIYTDPFFNRVVVYEGLALQANQIASPLLLAVAVALAAWQISRGAVLNSGALCFAVLLMISSIAGWNQGGSLIVGGNLTLLVVVLALSVMGGGSEAIKGAALGAGLILCLSAIAGLLQPDLAAPPCDIRKCGALGSFYVGVEDNQNTFGLMMAFSIPVMYLGLRRYNFFFCFTAAFFAFASGARTASVAAAVTLAAVLLIHVSRKSSSAWAERVVAVGAVGSAAVSIAVPFMKLPAGTFSDRGGLWALAREMYAESWLIGHGPAIWRSLVEIGAIPLAAGYSTHNQMMETLFVVGLLGAILMAIVIALVIWRNHKGATALALVSLPIAIAAITERPWSLGGVDWASWTLAVFLCMVPAVPLPEKYPQETALKVAKLADHQQ